jgi:DNA-binding PadR family transcriptional regulator
VVALPFIIGETLVFGPNFDFSVIFVHSMYRSDILDRVLELAILGILMEGDRHGYEIRTQLRDRLGLSSAVSFGSLYPALARLEREGLVEPEEEGTGRLSVMATGSLSGERASLRSLRSDRSGGRRGRKVYRLTSRGRESFVERLADPASLDDARSFSLRMSLARFLTPSVRIGLLESRRTNLVARLRDLTSRATSSELDVYGRSVLQHAARAVELDIAWIDELLTGERTNPHDALGAK